MMKRNINTPAGMTEQNDPQLELSLDRRNLPSQRTPSRRRSHAGWWFARMRQVVDRAFDWQGVPALRPEQIWLPGSYRQPGQPRSQRASAGAV